MVRVITPDTVTQRDLWDSAVMGCFVQRPSAIARHFWDTYAVEPAAATGWYHQQAVASNYIRASRTDQNVSWRQPTAYGEMDLTINVSKPEKDPRDIIAAAREQAVGYPQCLLCRENEGYAGRADHPARQNLRLIPMDLLRERWYLQYSRTATTTSTASCSATSTAPCASTGTRSNGWRPSPGCFRTI